MMGETKLAGVHWLRLVREVERMRKRHALVAGSESSALCEIEVGMSSINLSCDLGAWRKRRFYLGDTFRWCGVRQRRGGGLLIQLDQPVCMSMAKASEKNLEGFKCAEALYAELIIGLPMFAGVFKQVVGMSYDDLVAKHTCDYSRNTSAYPNAEEMGDMTPVPAPIERHLIIPDWGSW